LKTLRIIALIFLFIIFLTLNLFAQAPDTLWTRAYGGRSQDDGYSVKQLADSGYIIAGLTYSFGAGSKDVYILRIDYPGAVLVYLIFKMEVFITLVIVKNNKKNVKCQALSLKDIKTCPQI